MSVKIIRAVHLPPPLTNLKRHSLLLSEALVMNYLIRLAPNPLGTRTLVTWFFGDWPTKRYRTDQLHLLGNFEMFSQLIFTFKHSEKQRS